MCALGIGRGRQGPWDYYGTIGEDFLQRGVLKKQNICMRSRQWREGVKVKGGRRKKERILALHSDKKNKTVFWKAQSTGLVYKEGHAYQN